MSVRQNEMKETDPQERNMDIFYSAMFWININWETKERT